MKSSAQTNPDSSRSLLHRIPIKGLSIFIALCSICLYLFQEQVGNFIFWWNIWSFVIFIPHSPDLEAFWIVRDGQISRQSADTFFDVYPKDVHYEQHDPKLIQFIRDGHLLPPSDLPYNLVTEMDYEPSYGQAQLMKKLFPQGKGFFIECGAYNGEVASNTLSLERDAGWEGLLVEADPTIIADLVGKHRKAWILPNCLSTKTESDTVTFRAWKAVGKIVNEQEDLKGDKLVNAHCFPLFSVLKAMNRTKVDYFSLDIEGHELDILKTIPFNELDITALSVEITMNPDYFPRSDHEQVVFASHNEVLDFMTEKGYVHRATVSTKPPISLANDLIFVKKGFREDIHLEDVIGYNVKFPLT